MLPKSYNVINQINQINMKKIILILTFVLLSTGCANRNIENNNISTETEKPNIVLPDYELLEEKIDEMPVKTQIAQFYLVTGNINTESLMALLGNLYYKTIKRTGFKYHDNPNAIYIYAYLDKEHYAGSLGGWVAMLSQNVSENSPTINFDDNQLSQIGKVPEEKFGLSEDKRKEIWQAIVQSENRARVESEKQYPLPDPTQASYTQEKFNAQWEKQIDLQYSLQDKYSAEILTKYDITQDQFDDIAAEGITKSWAFPK